MQSLLQGGCDISILTKEDQDELLQGAFDKSGLFPHLDIKLVQELLFSLEFCIPVPPSVLNVDVSKFIQSEDTARWLLFPALITAHFRPPANIPENATQQSLHSLCWQLRTSEMHSLSAHVAQIIVLRLLAHFVVQQGDKRDSAQHCCSIWCNGIVWQSNRGIDISVHIIDNSVIQCIGRSNTLADLSYQYVTDVIGHILSIVCQLSPNLAAAAYIVHSPKVTTVYEAAVAPLPQELFPVEGIQNSIGSCNDYMLSCADTFGHSTRLLISELFGGWIPLQHPPPLCQFPLQHSIVPCPCPLVPKPSWTPQVCLP